jgi:thiol-disulfide isomerase/thioredoxin
MKSCFLIAAILLSANVHGADTSVGNVAPEIQAKLLDSEETFQLSHKFGKTVIVNFWATWCAPCKAEMPLIQAYLEKHRSEGLEVLAISMNETKDIPAVRKVAQLYNFQVALRNEASFKGLGRIWRMPTTFVIDKNGIIRKNGHVGDAEVTQAELESVVTPLLHK